MAGVAWEGQAEPCSRHPGTRRGRGPGEEARGRAAGPGAGLRAAGQVTFPSANPNSARRCEVRPVRVGPEAGPYLRELSDETSRSESSVSLGGGGGSLGGTAVKAGDFLEKKNTSCHLGADGTL